MSKYSNTHKTDSVWLSTLHRLLQAKKTSPRNFETREIINHTSVVDMSDPIVKIKARKMNYTFMYGEAYWILWGSNMAQDIVPYCKPIAKFSDDGVRFDGAYGPMVVQQIRYCVDCLNSDPLSRQAVMSIWRPNPRPSKDIPCTVSLQFLIRDGKIHCIANMRSSDIWLGWVYDVFNFSCVANYIRLSLSNSDSISLGNLYLNAASQHLYESDAEKAQKVIDSFSSDTIHPVLNPLTWSQELPSDFHQDLKDLRDGNTHSSLYHEQN